jgi:putative transposase
MPCLGSASEELCSGGQGSSKRTFSKWEPNFGGIVVAVAPRLPDVKYGGTMLKKPLAEPHLDVHALKSIFGVNHYPRIQTPSGWQDDSRTSSVRSPRLASCGAKSLQLAQLSRYLCERILDSSLCGAGRGTKLCYEVDVIFQPRPSKYSPARIHS